jgi:hypothetical protein
VRGVLGNLRKKGYFENLGVGERIILEPVVKKSVRRAWTGVIWFRVGTIGELLLIR